MSHMIRDAATRTPLFFFVVGKLSRSGSLLLPLPFSAATTAARLLLLLAAVHVSDSQHSVDSFSLHLTILSLIH